MRSWDFTLVVVNAHGPVQLRIMNQKSGRGLRLLGVKGSPDVDEIATWLLDKASLKTLIADLQRVFDDSLEGE